MANVQAYFQVAHTAGMDTGFTSAKKLIMTVSQRFMDYVPSTIEHRLNHDFDLN